MEGDILTAMGHLGVVADPWEARFRSASRTDAGVSALGNVLAVDTTFRPLGICRALNSQLEDIWFWGAATVDADFDPRCAKERWYRYHLPPGLIPAALRRCAAVFVGRHDFRAFTKSRAATAGEVRSITVSSEPTGLVADFRAPSFLWNMVRRLVGAMEAYARGTRTLEEIRRNLRTGRTTTGLAPATPLVLMDVLYDHVFQRQLPQAAVGEISRRLPGKRAEFRVLQGLTGVD